MWITIIKYVTFSVTNYHIFNSNQFQMITFSNTVFERQVFKTHNAIINTGKAISPDQISIILSKKTTTRCPAFILNCLSQTNQKSLQQAANGMDLIRDNLIAGETKRNSVMPEGSTMDDSVFCDSS